MSHYAQPASQIRCVPRFTTREIACRHSHLPAVPGVHWRCGARDGGAMARKMKLLLVLVFALAACASDAPEGVAVHRQVRGDTLVLTSLGRGATVTGDRVQVLWQSAELDRPRSMALAGNLLVIGDRTRVHLLRTDGDSVITFGREGAGPGEFHSIYSVGAFSSDTLAVYDGRNRRLTYLSPIGELLGSHRITPEAPFMNPSFTGDPLIPWRAGFLWHVLSGVAVGQVTRHALAWHDPVADTTVVLEEWEGQRLVDLGGVFGPQETFGPSVHIAIGPGPHVAVGNGLEYCITIRALETTTIRRLCRDRPRTPVGNGIRNPDLGVLESDNRRGMIQAIVRSQQLGDLLPSYDRLLFAMDGSLWVRTMGPELANVHPQLLRLRSELRPTHRVWDTFDAEGRFFQTVRLPAAFDPRVVTGATIYGFYELATGEIVVGAVEI